MRTPEDVLARVPFTLGFHPADSLVAMAVAADGCSDLMVRSDLSPTQPPPTSAEAADPGNGWPDLAHRIAAAFVHRGARHAILVAYTSTPEQARHAAGILTAALDASGIPVLDVLWVDGSRWWSLVCVDTGCCPAEGKPYHPATTRVAAESVYHGDVALPSERELRRSVAAVRGPGRLAMQLATDRMDTEACDRYLSGRKDHKSGKGRQGHKGQRAVDHQITDAVRSDGKAFVTNLIDRYLADSTRPTDDEVAWAGMYLYDVEVRDLAWLCMTEQTARQHVELWREVARRALNPYQVAPLTLLAFAAWLSGNGALARCALDRAQLADSAYSMARLVRDVVDAMVPPSVWPPRDGTENNAQEAESR